MGQEIQWADSIGKMLVVADGKQLPTILVNEDANLGHDGQEGQLLLTSTNLGNRHDSK